MERERTITMINQTAGSYIDSLREAYDHLGIACDQASEFSRPTKKRRRHFRANDGAKTQQRFAANESPSARPFGFNPRD